MKKHWLLPVLLMLPMAAQAVTFQPVVSPNGVQAWLVEDHNNPIIDLELDFAGGAGLEADKSQGLSSLVADLLDEGAGSLKSQEFHAKLEDMGISMSFASGQDGFHVHLKTQTVHADAAFELLHLALTQPRFDAEPIARVRSQALAELAQESQEPDAMASRAWSRLAFPHHPYGRQVDGESATIKGITRADLVAYVRTALAKDNLTIGAAGDVDTTRLGGIVDRVTAGLPAHRQGQNPAEIAPVFGGTQVVPLPVPQSVAIWGQAGIKRDDPDWFAAYVMNYILGGGGFSSWLTDEVREKRGLAYGVSSRLQPMRHSGLIMGHVATRNDKLAQSLEIIKQQWTRMRDQGPNEQELADAKSYLIGAFPLQLDSTQNLAGMALQLQLDHLGIDYLSHRAEKIQSVTRDDVLRVAQRILNPETLTVVVVGQPVGLTK